MKRIFSIVFALGVAVAVRGADLSEYVSDGLVAMWDGYRNLGADKAHDSFTNVWYDTTGTYGFTLNGARMGDICCKFSWYSGYTATATLSAEDTAATFEKAKSGTVEVVFWYTTAGCLLHSSTASGVCIGSSSGEWLLSCKNGAAKFPCSSWNRVHTISASYTDGLSVSAACNGDALATSGSGYWSNSATVTTLGATSANGGKLVGHIYAIRVYSRQLTVAELAQNAALDQERYFNRRLEASSSYTSVDCAAGVTADKWYYVAKGGSDGNDGTAEHPFATVTNAHAQAAAYLAANADKTAAVKVGEGEFVLDAPIALVARESLIGSGRDKTFFDGSPAAVSDAEYAIKLSKADSLVRGVTVMKLDEKTKTGITPHAFFVSNGTVDNCRAAFNRGWYAVSGVGLRLTGGTVTNSFFGYTALQDMSASGLTASVGGGLLVDSEICYDDIGMGRSISGFGLYLSAGTVRKCRIHDSGRIFVYDQGSSISLSGSGILENSLVYGNCCNTEKQTATVPAGIAMSGGTLRYCTVFNNRTPNDTVGYSGIKMTAGTARNNIFSHNLSTDLGVQVTGGTFDHNVVNQAVTGYDDNYVTTDPNFRDVGAADVHIAAKASAAVGKATPLAEVATDFDNVARDATKPTIGAFEYVASATEFKADLLVTQERWRQGTSPSVELVVEGVADESKLSVDWYVDGVEDATQKNSLVPVFAGLGLGSHTVKAVATYLKKTLEPEKADAFAILPLKTYAAENGGNVYPYDTSEKAASTLKAAFDALWKSTSETSVIEVAEGTVSFGDTLYMDTPVVIRGAGADRTILTGIDSANWLIAMTDAGDLLEDLAITGSRSGGAVQIVKGCVRRCRFFSCKSSDSSVYGVAAEVRNGFLLDCEISDCSSYGMWGYGVGLALTASGAVVSNSTIRNCFSHCSHANHAAGVYMSAGLLTNCRISHCGDAEDTNPNPSISTSGGGILVSGGCARNILLDHCSSRNNNAVQVARGCLENWTVTTCKTAEGVPALYAYCSNSRETFYPTTVTNCIVWGNSGTDLSTVEKSWTDTSSGKVYSRKPDIGCTCYSEATEGASGNTARNPKLRARRDYEISPFGSCYRAGAVQSWMTGATDLSGRPRTTTEKAAEKVDIGCHQVPPPKGAAFVVR